MILQNVTPFYEWKSDLYFFGHANNIVSKNGGELY